MLGFDFCFAFHDLARNRLSESETGHAVHHCVTVRIEGTRCRSQTGTVVAFSRDNGIDCPGRCTADSHAPGNLPVTRSSDGQPPHGFVTCRWSASIGYQNTATRTPNRLTELMPESAIWGEE